MVLCCENFVTQGKQQLWGCSCPCQEYCFKPAQKAKRFLTCDQQPHLDSWCRGLVSDPDTLPGFSISEPHHLSVSSHWKPPCPMPNTDIQLELLDLDLVPNAWIGIGIETFGRTPLPCCLWMNSLQPVLESLCQSTFRSALLLLPVLVPLCFLNMKPHTLCTSVSSSFSPAPPVPLCSHQISRHAAQTTEPVATAPALWGRPAFQEVLNP